MLRNRSCKTGLWKLVALSLSGLNPMAPRNFLYESGKRSILHLFEDLAKGGPERIVCSGHCVSYHWIGDALYFWPFLCRPQAVFLGTLLWWSLELATVYAKDPRDAGVRGNISWLFLF